MKTYPLKNAMIQADRAARLMQRYIDYALSIGCEVDSGTIHCNAMQSFMLNEWWEREKASGNK